MPNVIKEVPLSWSKGMQVIGVADQSVNVLSVGVRLDKDAAVKGEYNTTFIPFIAIEMDDEIDPDDFIDMHVWIVQNGFSVPDEQDDQDDTNEVEFAGSFQHMGELYHVYTIIPTPE